MLPVLLLSGEVQPLGGGSGHDNDGLSQVRLLVLLVLQPQLEGPLREINLGNGLTGKKTKKEEETFTE